MLQINCHLPFTKFEALCMNMDQAGSQLMIMLSSSLGKPADLKNNNFYK